MAISSTYCTHRDLKDIYPNVDEFDTKSAIYGWELSYTNAHDSAIDLYYANNTGSVTNLFWDGAKLVRLTGVLSDGSHVTALKSSTLTTACDAEDTQLIVASESNFATGDIIKVGTEYMRVAAVPLPNTISVSSTGRGLFGTSTVRHKV